MATVLLNELLDFAVDAAWQAGRITLRHFQAGVAVEEKADESPVTVADRGAEEKLRELIKARFPDDAILGEEHGGLWIRLMAPSRLCMECLFMV